MVFSAGAALGYLTRWLQAVRVMYLCLAVMATALVLFARPAMAFDATSSIRANDLPATGNAFRCRLTAENSEDTGPFAGGFSSNVRVSEGLERVGELGYTTDFTVPVIISNRLSAADFAAACEVSNVVISSKFDTSLSRSDVSLISVQTTYVGQDGLTYQAGASVSGQTSTVTDVIVSPITPRPDIAVRVNSGLVANNRTITLGDI